MSDKKIRTALAVCLMGYESKHGSHRPGERLRNDHPAVVNDSKFWIDDGLADDERFALLRERFQTAPK
jgi:hypothetical protein